MPCYARLLATAGFVDRRRDFFRGRTPGRRKIAEPIYFQGRGARFRDWFRRYGLVTVFISALIPVPILPFKVFVACAGAMGVRRLRFMLVLSAARIPRYLASGFPGSQLGETILALGEGHIGTCWGWPRSDSPLYAVDPAGGHPMRDLAQELQ